MSIEIVEQDGGNAYLIRGQAARDLRDGKALRRLREVLPDGGHLSLGGPWAEGKWNIEAYDSTEQPLPLWTVNGVPAMMSVPVANGYGPTIAEAADKCCDALVKESIA